MKANRSLVIIITLAIIIFVVGILVYTRTKKTIPDDSKIHIVTSFYPLAYVAQMVGAEHVSVRNLVPAGVEPHDFELSARDLVEIGNADLLMYNGASLEAWIPKWEQGVSVRPKQIINMASVLKNKGVLFIERNGATDPHFWLDPIIMKDEIIVMRDMLTKIDPAQIETWNTNAERALQELETLNQHFALGLTQCTLRDTVVLHEAFNYLARQYRFSVTSIEGISPEEEPSPKELARITDLVRAKGVKYIFFETTASPKFSELIAREVDGTTLVLNPIESLTPNEVQLGEDYISIMEMNLRNLRKAMSCN